MFMPICTGDVGYRYWRIYYTGADSASGQQLCSKLEMRGTPGGPDLTGGGVATASDTDGTYVAANAFDSDASTLWASATTGTGQWLSYDFGLVKGIAQISYMASSIASRGPTGIRLEYSIDGITWAIAQTWTPAAWAANTPQVFTV